MWTFFKIAWRDLWRNRLRSGLTLGAITFGTALLLFTMAWARGAHQQMIEAAIGLFPCHLQVHNAGYQEDKSLIRSMPLSEKLKDYLASSPLVSGYSPRLCTDALLQSGGNLSGSRICGVDPAREKGMSRLASTFFPEMQKLPKGVKPFRRHEGEFLEQGRKGEALIGKDLARNLQAQVGDEVSITSQDFYGSIAAASFKVKGIFRVGSPDLDGAMMLVNLSELADLLYMPGLVTEVAVMLDDPHAIPEIEKDVYKIYSKDEGPWMIERVGDENLWLVEPRRPNLPPESELQLADHEITLEAMERIPEILEVSPRLKAELDLNGQRVSTAGINIKRENEATGILDRLERSGGEGIKLKGREWLLLEESLAKSLGIAPGQDVSLHGKNYLGDRFEMRLAVAGTYRAAASDPEAFLPLNLLQEKKRLGDNLHQVFVKLDPGLEEDQSRDLIVSHLNYEVIPWEELMPDVVQFVALDNAGAVIWMLILLVVIAFVVLLTILMSVLERAREFGIMKAIGTRPAEVFWIILMESVCLGLVGGIMGTALGIIPSLYFTYIPLDLSSYAEYMAEFGIEPFMYARLELPMLAYTFAIMLFVVMIMTVFPAIRAARTRPVEVLRLQ